MKRLLLFISFSFLIFATKTLDFTKADDLINKRQYLDAFNVLEEMDRRDDNPPVVIRKTMLCLKYYSKSCNNHECFALTNLTEKQTLEHVRFFTKQFILLSFSPEKQLKMLINKYPKNWELYNTLGIYYYEVYKYKSGGIYYYETYDYHSNHSTKEPNIVLSRKYLQKVLDNNEGDDKTYYILGYFYALDKNYTEAVEYFKKAISINNKNGLAHYNLALVYKDMNNIEPAIEHATIASRYCRGTNEGGAMADAFSLVFSTGDRERIIKYSATHFDTNPNVTKIIMGCYEKSGFEEDVLVFFDRVLQKPNLDDKSLANIYFYRGMYHKRKNNREKAVTDLEKALPLLHNIEKDSSSPIFQFVANFIEENKSKK